MRAKVLLRGGGGKNENQMQSCRSVNVKTIMSSMKIVSVWNHRELVIMAFRITSAALCPLRSGNRNALRNTR